jgi:hypothetical protein
MSAGGRRPGSIEAAATAIAASGPNKTAVKRIGTREIDSRIADVRRTSLRSAYDATPQRTSTTHGFPFQPSTRINATSIAAVPRSRAPRYSHIRRWRFIGDRIFVKKVLPSPSKGVKLLLPSVP